MNYAIVVGLGAMIYVPGSMKIGLVILTLVAGNTHADTDVLIYTQASDLISLFLFFQN